MEPIPFIDPHVHADSRSGEDFPRLVATGCVGVVIVAGAGGGYRSPDSVLDHFRRLQRVDKPRLERHGLKVWLALGVHPAGIPVRRLDELLAEIPQALVDAGAQAVGEVGLQSGGKLEEQVLSRMFEVAAQLGLPALVHTPRDGKPQALARTLELLAASALPADRVLIDHLTPEWVDTVRAAGCWAGLTVQPGKLSPQQAADCVVERGADRLILDSDSGTNPSYLFALPAAAGALLDRGVERSVIQRLVHDHAGAWLGLAG